MVTEGWKGFRETVGDGSRPDRKKEESRDRESVQQGDREIRREGGRQAGRHTDRWREGWGQRDRRQMEAGIGK